MPARALITPLVLIAVLSAGLPGQETQTTAPAQAAAGPSPSSAPGPADSARLEIIKAPRPDYPLEAKAQGLQGQVWIQLLISETGAVENAEVVSGNPILAKAALEAMKKWKFKPFIKSGRAVKVSTKLPFDFFFGNQVFDVKHQKAAAPEESADNTSPPTGKTSAAENPSKSTSGYPNAGSQGMQLRVSQGVMEGMLLHRVQPVYPPEARVKRIQGTVLLEAKIGKDGRMHELKVISGPKELIDASVGAVQQWRYQPYLLKGEPVEVETTIKIQFHM